MTRVYPSIAIIIRGSLPSIVVVLAILFLCLARGVPEFATSALPLDAGIAH